jgi:hypothetical protein
VQLESARIVTGLPKFASRDSLYYETGWEPLSCRRKSRKLTTFCRSKCGTALVEISRALVFLGIKSTNHSFAHSFNFDQSLLISDFIIS